ncbi:hypothetical protein [Methylobacterium brachythecii]|uniref:Uncharacterized protein n=1 Tax=Methylobacterium brachythecii TaxID=1176177 RepID=A0A7W6F7P3_9HYPH|nr:hypothetical protein [Methylobacterium brachythecii]MBB3903574.1 hypothetical protein [Methylobacterium brachythecii]GLS44074.1 hypothetical protein GCM10007884_20610 [Methylobacterium brachythecii]
MLSVRKKRAALAIVEAETRKAAARTAEQVKDAAETSLSRVISAPQRVEVCCVAQTASELRVHVCGPDLFGGFTVRLQPLDRRTIH